MHATDERPLTGATLGDVAAALAVGIGGAALGPVRPAPGPATGRWGVGVGEAVAKLPWVPGPVRGLARRLNRFGSVVVSPGGIEFDGDEADWSAVSEIRTRRLVGYLLTDAVAKQLDRLPLWRFPGRGMIVDGLGRAALTAVALAADLRPDRGVSTVCVPCDVSYRGLLRDRQMSAGLPAALVLADPAVRDLVESTARAHGVAVRMADDDPFEAAIARATGIRRVAGRAAAVLSALSGQTATRSSACTAGRRSSVGRSAVEQPIMPANSAES